MPYSQGVGPNRLAQETISNTLSKAGVSGAIGSQFNAFFNGKSITSHTSNVISSNIEYKTTGDKLHMVSNDINTAFPIFHNGKILYSVGGVPAQQVMSPDGRLTVQLANGAKVLCIPTVDGKIANDTILNEDALVNIQADPNQTSPPQKTTEIKMSGNISKSSEIKGASETVFWNNTSHLENDGDYAILPDS
ncbi:MAG: hypothetical protein AB8B67_00800, partial [Rickettsiaceae bacterium]